MKKFFTPLFFLLGSFSVFAQTSPTDSLFVVPMVDGWMLMEKVPAGEGIPHLARRFAVPPAILAAANAKGVEEALREGSTLFVPLGAYNLTRRQPQAGQVDMRPLYYKVEEREGEKLAKIARAAGVSESNLFAWNGLERDFLQKGQVVLVGGLRYDATGTFTKKNPVAGTPTKATETTNAPGKGSGLENFIRRTDAILEEGENSDTFSAMDSPERSDETRVSQSAPTRSAEALAFEALEASGVGFIAEKGTAVFFPSRSRKTIYAFHNIAGRGSVIKVTNPLNGRAIYAKVLGPLPPTAQYAKATLGLSSLASQLLGAAGETRMWCEVLFTGY